MQAADFNEIDGSKQVYLLLTIIYWIKIMNTYVNFKNTEGKQSETLGTIESIICRFDELSWMMS